MFEAAELGRKIPKNKYERAVRSLRTELLDIQFAAREAQVPVLIIVSGADGAGKGELVHRLNEWFDPRRVDTHAFWESSDEERERPRYWRFWRALPARGRIAILFGSWYTEPIIRRVYGDTKAGQLDGEMDRICLFEQMLASDGAVIIKLWLHLTKARQRKQLKVMEKDPARHWRVLPTDWKHLKLYDAFVQTSERAIRHTDTGQAPWHIIEATDRRYRELTAGQTILAAIQERLGRTVSKKKAAARPNQSPRAPIRASELTILDCVDLTRRLSRAEYEAELKKWQGELSRWMHKLHGRNRSAIALFEGWDAAGKGSAIRRVTAAIDPRFYTVVPVAAPSDEERAHHYFWRFWRRLPRWGRLVIFDRSWYGRVLVERVEGFASTDEWRRAYLEINDFEEQLVEGGIVLAKFWIHISSDEQLRRFRERERTPHKAHKITAEDWRNRKKWDAYKDAINDMVAHTSTEFAPWTLVAGNDKYFARVQILKTLSQALRTA